MPGVVGAATDVRTGTYICRGPHVYTCVALHIYVGRLLDMRLRTLDSSLTLPEIGTHFVTYIN